MLGILPPALGFEQFAKKLQGHTTGPKTRIDSATNTDFNRYVPSGALVYAASGIWSCRSKLERKDPNVTPNTFEGLTYAQQMALAMGMHVRNALEDFHVDHLPDNLMPELNSTIRYAIYDFIENVIQDERALGWTVMMIPSYWEVPGRDPKPTFTGEYLWEGKPIPKTYGDGQDVESVGTDDISRQGG